MEDEPRIRKRAEPMARPPPINHEWERSDEHRERRRPPPMNHEMQRNDDSRVRRRPPPMSAGGERYGGGEERYSESQMPRARKGPVEVPDDALRVTGRCDKWTEKGFGFIVVDSTKETIFCHRQALRQTEISHPDSIEAGQRIEFKIGFSSTEDGGTQKSAVDVTGLDEEPLDGKREGYYSSYAANKARAGGVYYRPTTYHDKSCGGYKGKYGTYGALMRNDIKKKDVNAERSQEHE